MKIIDKTTTKLLAHTISGDYDTYKGWEEKLSTIDNEGKSIDDCIISGHEAGEDGLVWTNEESFAQDVLGCCNKRGEWQVDTYVYGQVEVDDGVDAATGIHRVHLEDDKMLAYVDCVSLSDITPNSCNADIQYKVTVVFDHDQQDYAKDDDGNLVAEDLDWDDPYMIIIEEL
jgi:hypothetical protein